MTEFENQVAQALGAIPHAANCARHVWLETDAIFAARTGVSKLPGRFDEANVPLVHACSCDREQRIAQRVAAAIEAGAEWGWP